MIKQNILLNSLEDLLEFIKNNSISKVTIQTPDFNYHYDGINFFMSSIENNIIMGKIKNSLIIKDYKINYPHPQNIIIEWV